MNVQIGMCYTVLYCTVLYDTEIVDDYDGWGCGYKMETKMDREAEAHAG